MFKKFGPVNFFQFLVIKTLDSDGIRVPDWIRIRIGIQHKMLDPDQYQMNTDQKHCLQELYVRTCGPVCDVPSPF